MTDDRDHRRTRETDGPTSDRDRYEWTQGDGPVLGTVEAVMEATGRDATDMPPLQDFVDTDALEAILTGVSPAGRATAVTFDYDGRRVRVDSDGRIDIGG